MRVVVFGIEMLGWILVCVGGDVNATFFCAVCYFRVLAPGLPLVHGCSTIMVVIDGCTGKHSLIHALAETLTNVLMNSGAAVTR